MSEEGGSWSKSQARRRRRHRNAAEGEADPRTEGNLGERDKTQTTLITQSQLSSEKPINTINIKENDKKEKVISDQKSLDSPEKINKKSDKRKKHKTTKQNIKGDDSKIDQTESKLEKKNPVSEEKTNIISNSSNSQLKTVDLKEESEEKTLNFKKINKKKFKQYHENVQNSQKQPNATNEKSSFQNTKNKSKNENTFEIEVKSQDKKSQKDENTDMKGEETKNVNANSSVRCESQIKSDCVHSINNPQTKEKADEFKMQSEKESPVVQSGLGSDDLDPHYTSLCSSLTVQSVTAGFFGVILETIEAAAGDQWILGEFNKCRSDIDRIQALRNNEKVNNLEI